MATAIFSWSNSLLELVNWMNSIMIIIINTDNSSTYIYIYDNCFVNPNWLFLFCGGEIWKLQLGGGFSMIFGCLP